jgi:TonB family protein
MAGILLFLSHLQLDTPTGEKNRLKMNRPVSFRTLSVAQFDKNRGKDAPPLPAKEPRTVRDKKDRDQKDKKQPETPPGQVVDVAPGNQQVADQAKFAAETNNAVKKETRAKEQTAFYRNAMPMRTATKPQAGPGSDPVEAPSLSGNDGVGDDVKPKKDVAQSAALEVPEQKAKSLLAMKIPNTAGPGPVVSNREESVALRGNSDKLNLQFGSAGENDGSLGRSGAPGVANLLPSPAVVDSIVGAAANDHLQDVEEGDGTYLNTREWKYASFFNRVKQSVGQQWNPNAQLRLRDPSLQIYGGRDRHTLLQITLTVDGRLKDAWVEKSSGLDFLDLEAVQAFERAQPFPNPPAGLVAADQTVRFQFGFYLEMSGRPGLRLFKSQN